MSRLHFCPTRGWAIMVTTRLKRPGAAGGTGGLTQAGFGGRGSGAYERRRRRFYFSLTTTFKEAVMAKPTTVKIKLVCTADTGFFYVTKKNPRNITE